MSSAKIEILLLRQLAFQKITLKYGLLNLIATNNNYIVLIISD